MPLHLLLSRLTLLTALLLPALSLGQVRIGVTAPPAVLPEPVESVDTDSPRAALADFLTLTHHGKFGEAARYLDLTDRPAAGELLAQKLTAVLDRKASVDLALLSPRTEGRLNDGLPADVDEVARLTGMSGQTGAIRIQLRNFPDGARWIFTRQTLDQVERWYDGLEDRWMREHLPEQLLLQGPRGLLWWQWLALPLLAVLALAFGRFFAWGAKKVADPLARRTRSTWDDEMLGRMRGPLTLVGALIALRLLLPGLDLYRPAEEFLAHVMRAGVMVALFWMSLRTVDLGVQLIRVSVWGKGHPASFSVIPLGQQVVKLAMIGMAVIAVLSELGYPVASLLAGLGIGGLALALAAQKTVENLFGSVSIIVDQPFRVGDFVKAEEITGNVEFVGLRSTRIRTLDRTVVTWPNGKLADLKTENFGQRDRIKLLTTLSLVYATTAAQMREVLRSTEALLRAHPKIHQPSVSVAFVKIGSASLEVEVFAHFDTVDYAEFLALRQEVLLTILELVEKSGTSLASASQTTVSVVPSPRVKTA